MHRTTGSDYTTIGGLPNQHINQSLPGTPGTTIDGEFLNALQEEIKAILDEAGITIETNPATDRSNGFHQMKDAIFDSAAIDTAAIKDDAITSAKIASCSLSNLIVGDLDYTVGEYTLFLDEEVFKITRRQTYPDNYVQIKPVEGIDIRHDISAIPANYELLELDYDGVKLSEVGDATFDVLYTDITKSQFAQKQYRDDGTIDYDIAITPSAGFRSAIAGSTPVASYGSYRFDGIEFQGSNKRIKHTVISVSDSGWTGSDPYYITVETGIPDTAKILFSQFSVTVTSTSRIYIFDDGSYNTDEMYFIPIGGTFDCYLKVSNYNPQSGHEDLFLTIIYSDPAV